MRKVFVLCFVIIAISVILFSRTIAVSIKPLALIVQSICKEDFEIKVVMSKTNPHLYALKISDMKLFEDADLIILSGIEDWVDKIHELFPSKTLIFSDDVFEHLSKEDKHLWLDPIYVVTFSHLIYQKLCQVAPENSYIYEQNWKAFADKIVAKTFEWYEKMSMLRNRTILEQHPALTHFAERFGVKQIISLESGHEEGITTKKLSQIISLIKKEKIRYIVVEENIDPLLAKKIAEQLKLSLVEIDILAQNSNSYENFIDSIISTLINAENTHR